jgi:NDP-sugar pyrophosphorylase family protein
MKTVLILAGGLGTRIRNLFPDCPKPLVPIGDRPFLQWQVELLAAQGFNNFVFCLSYLSKQVIDYFGTGEEWNININYSIESTPLGTAGAIKQAASFVVDTTLVLNGDTYFDTDYRQLITAHQQLTHNSNAVASLSLVYRSDTDRYGTVEINTQQQVTQFREKVISVKTGYVNAGAYIIEPAILDLIPTNVKVSLESEVFLEMIDRNQLYGLEIQGEFIDIGTPIGYKQLLTHLNLNS